MPRDFLQSEYKKTIGIKPVDLEFIQRIRGKKSRAGKLAEVISFYRESKHLEKK